MRVAHASLESISPYSPSRYYGKPSEEESKDLDKYRQATWRQYCHADAEGHVVIPATQFQACLGTAAQYLGRKIKGKGQQTFAKNFKAGVMVVDSLPLPIRVAEVESESLFLPANCKPGGPRINKIYPVVRAWKGAVEFLVFDETIPAEEFEYTLEQAGKFIGLGRFRPRNGGTYGRFKVTSVKWS